MKEVLNILKKKQHKLIDNDGKDDRHIIIDNGSGFYKADFQENLNQEQFSQIFLGYQKTNLL